MEKLNKMITNKVKRKLRNWKMVKKKKRKKKKMKMNNIMVLKIILRKTGLKLLRNKLITLLIIRNSNKSNKNKRNKPLGYVKAVLLKMT